MRWEAVTALSTVLTALIILVTNTVNLCADAENRVRRYYLRNPRPRPSDGEPYTVEMLLSRLDCAK